MFNQKGCRFHMLAVVVCGLFPVTCAADTTRGKTATVQSRWDLLTEQYWQRVADARHPAAPPRLVAIHAPRSLIHPSQVAMVHAGDPISVHSGGAESQVTLLATSLESGAPGDGVRARIVVTGAVVEVRIIDATSAVLMGLIRGRQ